MWGIIFVTPVVGTFSSQILPFSFSFVCFSFVLFYFLLSRFGGGAGELVFIPRAFDRPQSFILFIQGPGSG